MKINNFLLTIIFAVTSQSGTSQTKILTNNYVFRDSPQRNLIINFNSDSTFLLRNAVEGDLNYSLIGKWSQIDDLKFVVINSKGKRDNHPIAPPEGGRIDAIKAFSDKNYIFPTIYMDTVVFDEKYKAFELKGYKFKIGKRSQ